MFYRSSDKPWVRISLGFGRLFLYLQYGRILLGDLLSWVPFLFFSNHSYFLSLLYFFLILRITDSIGLNGLRFLFFHQTLNFLFLIGEEPINNVVVVSHEEWRDTGHTYMYGYIHVSILLSKFPSHPGQHITLREFHVPCNRFLLVIHFKYSSVYTTIPKSLTIPSPGTCKFIF